MQRNGGSRRKSKSISVVRQQSISLEDPKFPRDKPNCRNLSTADPRDMRQNPITLWRETCCIMCVRLDRAHIIRLLPGAVAPTQYPQLPAVGPSNTALELHLWSQPEEHQSLLTAKHCDETHRELTVHVYMQRTITSIALPGRVFCFSLLSLNLFHALFTSRSA